MNWKDNILMELKAAIIEAVKGVASALEKQGGLDGLIDKIEGRLNDIKIDFVPEAFAQEADVATNVAMLFSKTLEIAPPELAEKIKLGLLGHKFIESITIAKPAFINIRLSRECYSFGVLFGSHGDGAQYVPEIGKGEKVNVEYVSANPTGPLHIGHVRGAIYGSALANLLERVGFDVTREYYVNDGGGQIATLTKSALLRYRQAALGLDFIEIPPACYPGEYLVPVGRKIYEQFGGSLLEESEEVAGEKVRKIVIEEMMNVVKASMHRMGVKHDVFVSEQDMIDNGYVADAIGLLRDKGLCYKGSLEKPKGIEADDWQAEENQEIFRSTMFGDSSDRAIARADGSFSYFAPDIGYHYYKFKRGFKKMALILGADHKGYVTRISAAVSAISDGKASINVKLCELVNFIEDGQKVKSSKRSGKFLTADDILDELDINVLRFIILSRKNDTPLDFDLQLAKTQSKENPVFYAQYAHSRCASLLRGYKEVFGEDFICGKLSRSDIDGWAGISNRKAQRIITLCGMYSWVLQQAAANFELHTLVAYLVQLAGEFHSLWGAEKDDRIKFIQADNKEQTMANMEFVCMIKNVLRSCMLIIEVEPVETM